MSFMARIASAGYWGSTGSRQCSIGSAGYWPLTKGAGTMTLGNLLQIQRPGWEYEVIQGVGTDAYSSIFPFRFLSRFVMVLINNGAPAAVQFTYDLITLEDEVVYDRSDVEVVAARGFRIRNARAGDPVEFQVVAMR